MRLIVWNSQGNKWEQFWSNYLLKEVESGPREDVAGLLLESGWPPWVRSGDVRVSALYPFDSTATYYDGGAEGTSAFVKYKLGKRQLKALWVPWAKVKDDINGRTNSRCSMGAIALPAGAKYTPSRFQLNDTSYRRPVVTLAFGELTVFLVHLVSGKPDEATTTLDKLRRDMQQRIQSAPALIVGDMNINQLDPNWKYELKDPKNKRNDWWQIVNAGASTQKSGGELDFALLYNPTKTKVSCNVEIVADAATSKSDHAVMKYTCR